LSIIAGWKEGRHERLLVAKHAARGRESWSHNERQTKESEADETRRTQYLKPMAVNPAERNWL